MIYRDRGGIRLQVSGLLEQFGVEHGFSDASVDVSVSGWQRDEFRVRSAVGIERLHLLEQVHKADIVVVEPAAQHSNLPVADGWIVSRKSAASQRHGYGIRTADCLPLIIACPSRVALLHAGWRSVQAGIHREAVRLLAEEHRPSEFVAALGPCASGELYEVGEEFRDHFAETGGFSSVNGKLFFDLRATVTADLVRLGISSRMIDSSQECTMRNPQYHSHRRSGAQAGRNLSFVIV